MITEKFCPKCETVKPATSFYASKKRHDNLSSYCRVCQKTDVTSRYTPHPRWKAPDGHKWCPGCKAVKTMDEFGSNRKCHDGKANYCKPCAVKSVIASRKKDPTSHRKASNKWGQNNPELRHASLLRRYGLDAGAYDMMLEEQAGGCAICGKPPKPNLRLAVDHCHDTKQVRGLLCSPCNTGIGQLQHSEELLLNAITYLKKER